MAMQFENLPVNCPPGDSEVPDDFVCYRVLTGEEPTGEDFWSLARIKGVGHFRVEKLCQASGLSVVICYEGVRQVLKLPSFKRARFALKLVLSCVSGKIKETRGKIPGHYTWWKYVSYDPILDPKNVKENVEWLR